jgi:hypothetical protein
LFSDPHKRHDGKIQEFKR